MNTHFARELSNAEIVAVAGGPAPAILIPILSGAGKGLTAGTAIAAVLDFFDIVEINI